MPLILSITKLKIRAIIESFVKLVSELTEYLILVLLVALLSPSALLIKFPESLFISHERNDPGKRSLSLKEASETRPNIFLP